MTLLLLILAAGLLILALRCLQVIELSGRVIAEGRRAVKLIADPRLTDDEKERAVRRMTVEMLFAFWQIILRLGVALTVPAALLITALLLRLAAVDGLLVWSMSWSFLAANLVMFAAAVIWRRRE